jgi:hypothetical protein
MIMPPLVDGISTGEDYDCSDVSADELDRRHRMLIPDLPEISFNPLEKRHYFYYPELTSIPAQINRDFLE